MRIWHPPQILQEVDDIIINLAKERELGDIKYTPSSLITTGLVIMCHLESFSFLLQSCLGNFSHVHQFHHKAGCKFTYKNLQHTELWNELYHT